MEEENKISFWYIFTAKESIFDCDKKCKNRKKVDLVVAKLGVTINIIIGVDFFNIISTFVVISY